MGSDPDVEHWGTVPESWSEPATIVRTPWSALILDLGVFVLVGAIWLLPPLTPMMLPWMAVLVGFITWHWLAAVDVVFDDRGVTISDRLWRLRGRVPIYLPYSDGVEVDIYSNWFAPFVKINGLVLAGTDAVRQLRDAVALHGLEPDECGPGTRGKLVTYLLVATVLSTLLIEGGAGSVAGVTLYTALLATCAAPYFASRPRWRELAGSSAGE